MKTSKFSSAYNILFYFLCGISLSTFLITDSTCAQKSYYFHTVHSHGLSMTGGRTAKINYMYQLNHRWQFKLSGSYIFDSYSQNQNKVEADIYNANFQYQYNFIHKNRIFLNISIGAGGYYLTAQDILSNKHTEWKICFAPGAQLELYLFRNILALTVDYHFLYMPWSDIYDYLHVPTAGINLFFF